MLRLLLRSSTSRLASKGALAAFSSLLPAPAAPAELLSGYRHAKTAHFHSKPEILEIAKLGISPEIVSALAARGIHKLFPIQSCARAGNGGDDMYVLERTGTGKTLAFGIPILSKIIQYNQKHGRGKYPLALVLAPTRDLARQVDKEFTESSARNLDTICVYGGTPISKQIKELDYGVDVVVGTPGRIIDLMKRGSLNLDEVQFVVVDEADQMLAVGFVGDLETILQRVPKKNRQTMLFSATMPAWIKDLIRNYLNNPLTIDLVRTVSS